MRKIEVDIVKYSGDFDPTKSVVGKLDLTDSQNFPLAMTFGVADGSNIDTVFGDFSKTFRVPATKNNQKLLGFIDNALVVDSKNVLNKLDCRIKVDGLEIMQGKLKVTGTTQKKRVNFYDCVFYGGNADWGSQMKDKRMCDINFVKGDGITTPLNQGRVTYSHTVIDAIQPLGSDSQDIQAPLVSYGDFAPDGEGGMVNVGDDSTESPDWRYWIYVRNTLEYMFKDAGYKIKSDFMFDGSNAIWFKKLLYQLSWGYSDATAIAEAYSLRYEGIVNSSTANIELELNGNVGQYYPSSGTPPSNLIWQPFVGDGIQFSSLVKDTFTQYSQDGYSGVANGKITIAKAGNVNIKCCVNFLGRFNGANIYYEIRGWLRVMHNGTEIAIAHSSAYQSFGQGASVGTRYFQECIESGYVSAQVGDTFWVEVAFDGRPCIPSCSNNANTFEVLAVDNNVDNGLSYIEMEYDGGTIVLNNEFELNEIVDCSVKQADFIKGIAHMFNLFFYTDVQSKTVFIEPFNDFYARSGGTLDWTTKIDFSKAISDKYKIDLKNEILFKYKDDSNDKYVEWLNEQITTVNKYFEYYEIVGTQFDDGIRIFQNPLFSATKEEHDKDVGGQSVQEPVRIPVMESEPVAFGLGLTPEPYRPEKSKFAPRILMYDGYVKDGSVAQNSRFWFKFTSISPLVFSSSSTYPRAVFIDPKQITTSVKDRINLSYNDERHEDNSIMKGLYSEYWSTMIEQLKLTPRVRTMYFNLKIIDIINLDLSKLVYVDGSWWRINKISDFKPAQNETTKVELIQWFDVGKRIPTTTNSPIQLNFGGATSNARLQMPIANSPRRLGMSQDGIMQEQKGTVYVENSLGEYVPVLMHDKSGNWHNVVRSSDRNDKVEWGVSSQGTTGTGMDG